MVEYLTGGRIRFGTQKIDPQLRNEFILYRFSTHQSVKVELKPGVFPAEVARLEAQIRRGNFSVADMRRCQQWEWDYARNLLQHPLTESFTVTPLAKILPGSPMPTNISARAATSSTRTRWNILQHNEPVSKPLIVGDYFWFI